MSGHDDASDPVSAGHLPEVGGSLTWIDAGTGGSASTRLLTQCYAELRRIAARLLAGDAAALRLQPTDLAHEAALKVLRLDRIQWQDRTHFLATAATLMRQALLDEMRRARADKRQLRAVVTTLFDPGPSTLQLDVEALDASLKRLTEISAERARLVELRFFAGLTIEESAQALGTSPATVKRQWDAARAWLVRDIGTAGRYLHEPRGEQ